MYVWRVILIIYPHCCWLIMILSGAISHQISPANIPHKWLVLHPFCALALLLSCPPPSQLVTFTELCTDHVAQSTALQGTLRLWHPGDILGIISKLGGCWFHLEKNWKSNGRIISGKDGKKKILEATRQMTWPLGSSHGFWMIEAHLGLYPRPVMVPIYIFYWVSNLGLWLVARLVQWQPKLPLFLLFLVDAAASISMMVSYSCSW